MEVYKLVIWIEDLIKRNELWRFYKSKEWIKLKTSVLKENHYECAECKKHGVITRYDKDKNGNEVLISTVHHIAPVRVNPALALTRSNLMPLCKACHNKLHPEKNQKRRKQQGFTNIERW